MEYHSIFLEIQMDFDGNFKFLGDAILFAKQKHIVLKCSGGVVQG
jgi:hypothetical protein